MTEVYARLSDAQRLLRTAAAAKLPAPQRLPDLRPLPDHRAVLAVHLEQLTETDKLIAYARAEGSERKLEMNENERLNLVRVIEGLQSLTDDSELPNDAEPASDVA